MVFPDISVCRWQGLVTTEYQAMIYVCYPTKLEVKMMAWRRAVSGNLATMVGNK